MKNHQYSTLKFSPAQISNLVFGDGGKERRAGAKWGWDENRCVSTGEFLRSKKA